MVCQRITKHLSIKLSLKINSVYKTFKSITLFSTENLCSAWTMLKYCISVILFL